MKADCTYIKRVLDNKSPATLYSCACATFLVYYLMWHFNAAS